MKTLITTQSSFTHYGRIIRTRNRNNILLLHFLEAYFLNETDGKYDFQKLNDFVAKYSNQEKVDVFLNKVPIAFGKHIRALAERSPRTLEHSMEDLFKDFMDELLVAPDKCQIDYDEEKIKEHRQFWIDNENVHAPGSCPL